MIFVLIILMTCILFNVKLSEINDYFNDYLSLDNTQSLRGICALIIILDHLSLTMNEKLLTPFGWIGSLAVGIFFFISGYGLMYGLLNKKDYLKDFLYKRLSSIILPYFMANILYFFIRNIIEQKISLKEYLITFINGHPYVDYSWYIIVISMFYIMFYINFKYFNINVAIICSIIFICLYVIVAIKINYSNWWYNSCFPLIIGLIWRLKLEKINIFFHKHYYKKLILMFTIFGIVFVAKILGKHLFELSIIFSFFDETLTSISFTICCLLILMKLRFNNIIINWCGEVSLEVYLIHGLIIRIVRSKFIFINNNIVYTIVVILLSFIMAFIFNKFINNYKNIVGSFKIKNSRINLIEDIK